MMTNTAYDPRLLAQWAADLDSTQEIEQLLEPYLHQYDCAFSSFKQTKHFADFVRGLLSPLDRKSIEPIALHFHGEKSNESYGYNTDEIVSSDIVGMSYGSLFDATQTMALPTGCLLYTSVRGTDKADSFLKVFEMEEIEAA